MTSPEAYARESLELICESMPADLQSARAPVEARRHLLGLTEHLPAAEREAAGEALEVLIEERFGPQGIPLSSPSVTPTPMKPTEESIWAMMELAVGNAFSTTFDGSKARADFIAAHARDEAGRVLEAHRGDVGFFARRRLKARARKLIADETTRLLD